MAGRWTFLIANPMIYQVYLGLLGERTLGILFERLIINLQRILERPFVYFVDI
jgi:hypothetical protein